MGFHNRLFLIAGTAALLAGCASSGTAPTPQRPGQAVRQPTAALPQGEAGGDPAMLGRTAGVLVSLFGQPALDVHEGNARKLQFLGQTCVLDAYLYPQRGRGEAVVTHVDARLPDGRDADQRACIESLRRR